MPRGYTPMSWWFSGYDENLSLDSTIITKLKSTKVLGIDIPSLPYRHLKGKSDYQRHFEEEFLSYIQFQRKKLIPIGGYERALVEEGNRYELDEQQYVGKFLKEVKKKAVKEKLPASWVKGLSARAVEVHST